MKLYIGCNVLLSFSTYKAKSSIRFTVGFDFATIFTSNTQTASDLTGSTYHKIGLQGEMKSYSLLFKLEGTNSISSSLANPISEIKQIYISKKSFELDVSMLNKGVYFIEFNTAKGFRTLKFVKM